MFHSLHHNAGLSDEVDATDGITSTGGLTQMIQTAQMNTIWDYWEW